MSVSVIEDGIEGITHYKRRREEQEGGAFIEGITHYKRRREEQEGGAFIDGITPYKTKRNERDGWDINGESITPQYDPDTKAEREDAFVNAPGVNGLSDAVMVIEGVDFLFDFPNMGSLEEAAMKTSAEEAAPSADSARQEAVLKKLLDDRRAVIATSDARIVELQNEIDALDKKLAEMAKAYDASLKKGDANTANALERDAVAIDKKQRNSQKRAIRYAKLRTLAMVLARNGRSQLNLIDLARNARARGDATSANTFAQAFKEIGDSTNKILELRKEQQRKWRDEDERASGGSVDGLDGLEDLGDDSAKRKYRLIEIEKQLSVVVTEVRRWKRKIVERENLRGLAARKWREKLRGAERRTVRNLDDRFNKLRAEKKALESGAGLSDIPRVWEAGDIMAELRRVYANIHSMKAAGKDEASVRPLYDRAYNLRRLVEEAYGQGLTGLDGILSTVWGGVKKGAKTVGSATKTAIGAVAKAGVKVTKFAACGVLAKPQVQAAAASTPHPAGQAAAVGGAMLSGACGKGAAGQQAAEAAGIQPFYVTGQQPFYQKPVVGGVTVKHLLIGAGAVAVVGTGIVLATRHKGGMNEAEYEETMAQLAEMAEHKKGRKGKRKAGRRRSAKKGRRTGRRARRALGDYITDSFRDAKTTMGDWIADTFRSTRAING